MNKHLFTSEPMTDQPKDPISTVAKLRSLVGLKELGWLEGSCVTEEPTPARVATADHSSEEPSLPDKTLLLI